MDRPKVVPQQPAFYVRLSRRREAVTRFLLLFDDVKRRLLVLPAGRTDIDILSRLCYNSICYGLSL